MSSASTALPHTDRLSSDAGHAVARLRDAGVRDPDGDVQALAAVATAEAGHLGEKVFAEVFDNLIEQRAGRVPLEYLTRIASLKELEFRVGPGAFIPRRQSETYLEAALDFLRGRTAPRVLDLCSGVGALA